MKPNDDATAGASISALMNRAVALTTRLVRAELALARLELAVKARRAGLSAGLFGLAAVLVWHAVFAVLVTAVVALDLVWPLWLAALAVTLTLLVAVAVLAFLGRRRLARSAPMVPGEAVDGVRADARAIASGWRKRRG